MVDLVKELRKHLAETPREQLDKEWEELKKYNFGPNVFEYVKFCKEQYKKRNNGE